MITSHPNPENQMSKRSLDTAARSNAEQTSSFWSLVLGHRSSANHGATPIAFAPAPRSPLRRFAEVPTRRDPPFPVPLRTPAASRLTTLGSRWGTPTQRAKRIPIFPKETTHARQARVGLPQRSIGIFPTIHSARCHTAATQSLTPFYRIVFNRSTIATLSQHSS